MISWFSILRRNPRQCGLRPGEVFLTFDDGPNLEDNVTPDLLDVLQRHSVKAGFCLVGREIRRHPQVVQRMYYSGHLLINHTQHHEHPVRQNTATLMGEVDACEQEFRTALGVPDYRSEYFRAPYGIVTPAVRRAVKKLGMKQVLLSHYGWDTRASPATFESVLNMTIASARRHGGGLFVFHDGSLCPPAVSEPDWNQSIENRSWVPVAVDRLITALQADGLRFVIPQSSVSAPDRRLRTAA